jgi:uncharacterized protein YprB with RNaseH-like and TPR domain
MLVLRSFAMIVVSFVFVVLLYRMYLISSVSLLLRPKVLQSMVYAVSMKELFYLDIHTTGLEYTTRAKILSFDNVFHILHHVRLRLLPYTLA